MPENPPNDPGRFPTDPTPVGPAGPSGPNFLTTFGHRLSSVFHGDRERRRLERILSDIFARDQSGLLAHIRGQGKFGRGDLNRLLGSGLVRNPARVNFLQELQNRLRALTAGSRDQDPAGGGHPSGGTGHGSSDALGGRIGSVLDSLLNRRDINTLPGDLEGSFLDRLFQMLENPGMDPAILDEARNIQRLTSKTRERDNALASLERFASRNISGSGLQQRDLRDIAGRESERLRASLSGIDLANAEFAQRQIDSALRGVLGFGQLNLGEEGLASNELLDALRLSISRELGLGNLELGHLNFGLDAAQLEFLINQILLQNFSGIGDSSDPGSALANLFGGATNPDPVNTQAF